MPKLRFPEFSSKWESKILDDVFSKGHERNFDNRYNYVLTNSAVEGIVSQLDYFDKNIANQDNLTNYYIVDVGDFVYNPRISKYAPVGPFKRNKLKKGIMSPLYTILKPKTGEPSFFESYFSTNFWHNYMYSIANYGARHDRMNILQDDFMKMPLPFPTILEQKKIADFLGLVDSWLENLKAQKENFESYKKGMMQKIFSQEIRFKDDNGKNFPKREEKKLGDVCNIKKGKQLNRAELSLTEEYPVINGGVEPSGYTNIFNTKGGTISISEGGNSCGFVNFIKEDFWCGGHCYSLLNIEKNILDQFLYHYMKFMEKNIMRLRVGSGLPNIQKKDIEKFKLNLPSIQEQQKIAEFLTSLDKLIESKQQQITQTELWKKGLMQELFV